MTNSTLAPPPEGEKPSGSKAEGAFLALAAGDALGWPQEVPRNTIGKRSTLQATIQFQQWTRRGGGRFLPFEEVIRAGDYSDDTQLMLAVARCRADYGSGWWKALTRVELPLWTLYERGGGGATKRAAKSWAGRGAPWRTERRDASRQYFEAGGNGVAMRILPHAVFLAGQDSAEVLMRDVALDGTATHGHPRALVGAAAFAHAAWSLVRLRTTLRFGELPEMVMDGASTWGVFPERRDDKGAWFDAANRATHARYRSIWRDTVDEMLGLLQRVRREVQKGALANDHEVLQDLGCLGREKGAGTISTAAAVYLAARHAAQPTQGIVRAAFENGADSDTIAAMTGGLMGCLAGSEWLPPEWLRVQDAEYLRRMAARVALGPEHSGERRVERHIDPREVLTNLTAIQRDQELEFGERTNALVRALPDPKPIGRNVLAKAWQLTTSEGQTVFITKLDRRKSAVRLDQEPAKGRRYPPRAGSDLVASVAEDVFYSAFRTRLEQLLKVSGSMKPSEIEKETGLVRSQVKAWLSRAKDDGWLQQTSERPVRVQLRDESLV